MKNFLRKYRISVSVSVFVLIGLPLFYWSALFAVKKIQEKADMIQKKLIDNNLEKLKIEEIPKMEEANNEFEKNKDSVGTIINSDSKIDFIRYIELLAEETNNKIELKVLNDDPNNSADIKKNAKIAVKKDKKTEEEKDIEDELIYKQYISLQVDLTGDYQSFLNFTHKLENNKYYVNVISLNLKKSSIENKNSLANGNSASSNGIFLSPANQNNAEIKLDEESVLKSSLNIIVYME